MIVSIRVHRPGHSLVELMVGLGAAALLVSGIASIMFLAGQTLDHSGTMAVQTKQANDAFDDVALDLAHATSFSERTSHAATFKVPDRDGDEVSETIRYSWSGAAGAPLLMTYNGGTPAILAARVRAFNLSYFLRPVTGAGFSKGMLYDPSLVAWWEFNDNSGTVANDTTANVNHGTLTNGPTWMIGYYGGGLAFDGTDDYVAVPHSASLSLTTNLTISAWVYGDVALVNDYCAIVNKGMSDKQATYRLAVNGRAIEFGYFATDGSDRKITTPNQTWSSQWYHIAATLEPSGTRRFARIYFNGVQIDSGTLDKIPRTNTESLAIGRKYRGDKFFQGYLDDIRIYGRTLSADEILGIMNGTFF